MYLSITTFPGGAKIRVQQGGDQAMHRPRVSWAAVARASQAPERLGYLGVEPILDDAQGQGRPQAWMGLGGQFDQVAAVAEHLGGLGEHASLQAGQHLGSRGLHRCHVGAGEQATVHQHQHARRKLTQ